MDHVDIDSVKFLVFGSGGANGWIFVGLMLAIERELAEKKRSLAPQLHGASGASVGSLMALSAVLGYGATELCEFFKRCTVKYRDVAGKMNLLEVWPKKGLMSTSVIGDVVRDMIEQKLGTGARSITLAELHARIDKRLVISAHNLSYDRNDLLDHVSSPHLEVATAIEMSCAMPGIFQPVVHADSMYQDGAMSNALPFEPFDLAESLVFNVFGHQRYMPPAEMTFYDVFSRVTHIYNKTTRLKLDIVPAALQCRILSLEVPCLTGAALRGFILSDEERERLINVGLTAGLTMFHYHTAMISRAAFMYHHVHTAIRPPPPPPPPAAAE